MTLNVSLLVPDGIVIACDSLATLSQALKQQKMNVSAKCEKCGNQFEIKDVEVPPMSVPSSTWAYSQKLFPVGKRVGLATYGAGFINGRSIYNHVIELAPKLPGAEDGTGDFDVICDAIKDYFHQQLLVEMKGVGQDPNLFPDGWLYSGFQVVGFARGKNGEFLARRSHIGIGKKAECKDVNFPCYVTGDLSVVSLLWANPQGANANFGAFSLQDAIDYSKFLIRTTADYQRFSGNMPTVGGEIDIALVTNHRGFQWIAQKELYRKLDAEKR
jgi:hypothetical protein